MSGLVYQAINAVAAELATCGIPKSHRNEEGDYDYRGIEDVLAALAPLLAQHKLCVLPRVLEREANRLGGRCTDQLVVVRVAFDLVNALDGSAHVIESFGEAIDDSDKGTLRVLEPTPSVAVATIDPAIPAQSVEFYLTRPSGGGGAETRRLGVARYRDSDHNWRIRFVTDRFADTPQDAVVVHAEVIGVGGQLLAVAGSGGIC